MNLLSKVVARLWLIMMVYFFFTHYAAETGVDIYIYIQVNHKPSILVV